MLRVDGLPLQKAGVVRQLLSVGVCVLSVFVCLASRAEAATLTVCASGCAYTDLQPAIDAAKFGDTILLRAGATFVGHYTLRAKSGTGTIVIRSDASDSSLPPSGARLVPSDRGGTTSRTLLPRILGRGGAYKTAPLLRTEPGAHGYVIRFIEFDGAAHLGYETLIQLGDDTTAAAPYDITLDRVYIHGHKYKGQKRGVTLNGKQLSVLNSYISDIKAVNADSQALLGYNGAGPITIQNNYLEGAGENVMFGGADPAVTNLVPSNIVLRGNYLFKPFAWRNAILENARERQGGRGQRGVAGVGHALLPCRRRDDDRYQDWRCRRLRPWSRRRSVRAGGHGDVERGFRRRQAIEVYRGTSASSQAKYLETTATRLAYKGASKSVGRARRRAARSGW